VHFGQVGITENSQAVVVEIVADALANIEYDLADSENYFKGSTSLKPLPCWSTPRTPKRRLPRRART